MNDDSSFWNLMVCSGVLRLSLAELAVVTSRASSSSPGYNNSPIDFVLNHRTHFLTPASSGVLFL